MVGRGERKEERLKTGRVGERKHWKSGEAERKKEREEKNEMKGKKGNKENEVRGSTR